MMNPRPRFECNPRRAAIRQRICHRLDVLLAQRRRGEFPASERFDPAHLAPEGRDAGLWAAAGAFI